MRSGAAALAVAVMLLVVAGSAAAALEPVSLEVTAPPVVALRKAFQVQVAISSDATALDIAAQPMRMRVRLAPECGGSFAGTEGLVVFDRLLAAPSQGAPYSTTVSGQANLTTFGPETVCAFLEDAEERQFATSTDEEVLASRPCTTATQRLARLVKARMHARKRARRRHLKRRVRHARYRQAVACGSSAG